MSPALLQQTSNMPLAPLYCLTRLPSCEREGGREREREREGGREGGREGEREGGRISNIQRYPSLSRHLHFRVCLIREVSLV